MNYSKSTRKFIYEIIEADAEFDYISRCYTYHILDLADFDLYSLCSKIILDNPGLESECTSIDNPFYEKIMVPALHRHLTDITDQDLIIEFNNAWRKGIAAYLSENVTELINNALEDFNQDMGCTNKEEPMRPKTLDQHYYI